MPLGRFLRRLLQFEASLSIYAALGASAGGIVGLIGNALGYDGYAWFFFGFLIPLGPTYLYFASFKVFRRRLENLKSLNDEGLLTPEQFKRLRERAVTWYGNRVFAGKQEAPQTAESEPVPAAEPEAEE